MATDVRKFLDSAGVGILWNAITTELNKKAAADNVYTKKEVDDKIAALNLAETYEGKGAAAQALADANAYTNTEMAKIQILSEEDIDAAIAAAQT